MNILMISSDYLPNIGGVANHVYEISNALSKIGNNVTVLTCQKHFTEYSNKQINENFNVIQCPMNISIPKVSGLKRYITYNSQINKIIKEDNIDIIHNHCLGIDSLVLKRFDKIPKVFTNHTSTFLYLIDKKLYKKAQRQINHYDHIIAPSRELKDATVECGIKDNIITYIPNGVDTNRFNNLDKNKLDEIRCKKDIRNTTLNIICARRPVVKNGVKYLVLAVNELVRKGYDIKLYIVGDTDDKTVSEKEDIINIINEEKNDRIILCGAVKREDMPYYYSVMDVSCLPSLKEAVSLTALESMAAELPVISSNVGGLPEVVKDKYNGLLMEPKDYKAIARAIEHLYNNKGLINEMGKNARQFVETNFSWTQMAQQTNNIYKQILNRK